MSINWYPGHMAKARREMKENLSLVDAVVEVLDARAPLATRNPDIDMLVGKKPRVCILNKSDLANPDITKAWAERMKADGHFAIPFAASKSGGKDALIKLINESVSDKVESWKKRGGMKTVRVMVVGIPNVGKSTVINRLSSGGKAKTGSRPGVTRGRQWVKLGQYLEMMDTPGMLWPKLDDDAAAMRLAYINAIRDEVLDKYEIALSLITELGRIAPASIGRRYDIDTTNMLPEETLQAIARRRGYAQKGGSYDDERAAQIVVEEFRSGKLGRISLEKPGDLS